MNTPIQIPMAEYLALQRLLGFCQSIKGAETVVVSSEDHPPFREDSEVRVPLLWRTMLLEHCDKCAKSTQP